MRDHEYYAALISRRLDGDLTKSEQDELYAHLKDCQECKQLAEDMLFVSMLARDSMVEPPDTLHASIMREVRAAKSRRRKVIPTIAGTLAASIALVLVVRGAFLGGMKSESASMSYSTDSLVMEAKPVTAGAMSSEITSAECIADSVEEIYNEAEIDNEEPTAINGMVYAASLFDAKQADSDGSVESDVSAEAVKEDDNTSDKSATITNKMAMFRASPAPTPTPDESGSDVPETFDDVVDEAAETETEIVALATFSAPAGITNSLNVNDNRLFIDRSDMVAVSYNGTRVEASDPGFGDIAGRVLGYLGTFELQDAAQAVDVVATTEYVVEYADGHSETLLYSADGYLNCNGVWYNIVDSTPVEATEPAVGD